GLSQPIFNETHAQGLNVAHTFYGVHVGGDLTFQDAYIDSGSVLFRRFGDDQGSGENHFNAKVSADIANSDLAIATKLTIDYLGGSFDRNYTTTDQLNYGNFNIGLAPTYRLIKDDLTLDLGVSLFYLNDTEYGDNKFYIYPNVSASYRVVDEVLI